MQNFYDEFSEHYDEWVHHDALNEEIITFYRTFLEDKHQKTVVYLGIATGRIALKLFQKSATNLIGIDNSKKMIDAAKENFIQQKKQVALYHHDILELGQLKKIFDDNENIFLLPFRTLGHFVTLESKKSCMESIYGVMKKGEYFLFDMELFDTERAKKINHQPIVGFYDDVKKRILYNTFHYDFTKQSLKVDVHSANLVQNDAQNSLSNLQAYSYEFSWIKPQQLEIILEGVGFKMIQKHISDVHQMWIVQK